MRSPRKRTSGTVAWGIEIASDIADAVLQFMKDRGETKRKVVEDALRRHLAYPPPPEVPINPPPPAPFPEENPPKPKRTK